VFFDAEELEVHALALAPGGGIYAATSPDGKIYKIDSAGKSSVLFDPPDKYIWGLAVDKMGNVFAATGDKGIVYKITADGKGSVFYQTKTTHAISLAVESDGHLLVGTESPGRLFRLDANGKPFVLLDSPYNEIHTLKIDAKGVIYAAAVSASGGGVDATADPVHSRAVDAADGERFGVHGNHRHRRCRRDASGRRRNDVRSRASEHRRVRRWCVSHHA
jgi:outer membrane protein assembly factor BamB